MSDQLLVGIDIGTTAAKAIICDEAGQLLAQAGEEYPTHFPQPNWAEQDPDDWWRAICAVLRRVLATSGCDPAEIAAISISSQAPTLVAVDPQGKPLYPALIWMDRRSDPQCEQWNAGGFEAQIARINGGRIDPYYLAPKIGWLRDCVPDIYARCHQILQANGYIVHKLCGRFCMDSSHAPLTLLYDSAAGQWSDELLALTGIDRSKLPPVLNCSEIIGEVTPEAAAATGLAPGTSVIAGMTDGTAAGIEAGLVRPGDAAEMTGQSTVLLICSDRPYQGDSLIPLGHPSPGLHLVVGALVASGGALRWFRDQLGEVERQTAARQGVDPFDLLGAEAAQSPPGANRLIFLPYMYGERSPIWDSNARGVFFGLSLATQKRDLIRSIMEGAAFGLRHNIEVASAAGFVPASLACVGGGSRSALWNQIKADVLNRPVHLPRAAVGAPMGDAMMAAVAAGFYPSVVDAVAHMVASGPVFEPSPARVPLYDDLYQVYLSLYPALRSAFHALAEVKS